MLRFRGLGLDFRVPGFRGLGCRTSYKNVPCSGIGGGRIGQGCFFELTVTIAKLINNNNNNNDDSDGQARQNQK